jgi:hypothetical protein
MKVVQSHMQCSFLYNKAWQDTGTAHGGCDETPASKVVNALS